MVKNVHRYLITVQNNLFQEAGKSNDTRNQLKAMLQQCCLDQCGEFGENIIISILDEFWSVAPVKQESNLELPK